MPAITNAQMHTTFTVYDRKRAAAKAREIRDEAFEALMATVRASENKKPQTNTAEPEASLPGIPLASMLTENAESVDVSDSLFSYWVNILPTDDRFYVGNGMYQYGSRLMTLEEDYKAWKSTQAPLELPAESCTEEEKLTWMREHYSGELGPYELVDAIESMHDLGLMDRYEWNSVYGRSLTIITDVQSIPITDENGEQRYIITDPRLLGIREVPPDEPPWGFDDHFDRAPLHKLHTLQDLENWLKEFRTQPVADWEVKRRELMARDGIIEHFFVKA